MQFPGQGKPPVGIVYDTGLSRPGDALALAMLHGLEGKREARLIGVSVSRSNLKAAIFCEAVNLFYAGPPPPGPFAGFLRSLPVGLAMDARLAGELPLFAAPLAKHPFRSTIKKLNDTADPVAVVRNAMESGFDDNTIVLLSGPATVLASVVALRGAREMIGQKVKLLALAVGAYPEGEPDPYLQADVPAAQKLLAEWPTPIIAAGTELGSALPYPGASLEKDFAWTPAHPVAEAYRAHRPMPYDAPAETLAAALYAVRGKDSGFQLSEPGTISVAAEGRARFTPAAQGKHRYLIAEAAEKERIVKTYTEIVSAKPVPRAPRRPPQ
jgi:hypothetical protein